MTSKNKNPTELKKFMDLSLHLTGFSEFELYGTGQAYFYYTWVKRKSERELLELLDLPRSFPSAPDARNAYIETQIMQSASLGPVARSIIKLWYLGQWDDPKLKESSEIPNPESYRAGLVWQAINAHPQGAKQQGFGAWSLPPETAGES